MSLDSPRPRPSRLTRNWPAKVQLVGLAMGLEQVIGAILGTSPNSGIMTVAGAMILFQRAVSAGKK